MILGSIDAPTVVDLGRAACGDPVVAERREWLVTNGLGGFASGTLAGTQTRCYHGLLVAALKPPVGRTFMVAKLDELVAYDGGIYALGTNRWHGGVVAPDGYRWIERFRLEGGIPTWTFAFADALLEKRIWMEQDANTTFVEYRIVRATRPVQFNAKALVNYRDFHATTHAGDWQMKVERVDRGVEIVAFGGATPLTLRSDRGGVEPTHEWYRAYDLAEERARGLDDSEDHLHAATFTVELAEGAAVTFSLSARSGPEPPIEGALARRREHERAVLDAFASTGDGAAHAPAWVKQLVVAADQFIVRRPIAEDPEARSVIAGYHWFGDWGRDTMIALPGLTLVTGRAPIAAKILETFGRYVDRGMLPNYFPDAGQAPEYNTVDASLWYVEAVRQLWESSSDQSLLRRLYPVLNDIVDCYRTGTRYGIREDGDGLITAGEPGVQLTWMDAKVGDWVVTPRIGKPVEISALWYNALCTMAEFARELGVDASGYDAMAAHTRAGFERFWNDRKGYCFDVLDGPDGNDEALRPNQLLAVALRHSPLSDERARAILDVCGRRLLTTWGLRSLAEGDAGFRPTYGGSPSERDGAYHQGTVWGWLVGPWVTAHLRVYGDPDRARALLEAAARGIEALALGTLCEIADAEAPFVARGAVAQAWTVAEMLRAWRAVESAQAAARPAW